VSPTGGRTLPLSVVVPATDRPATLGPCRDAILSADDPPEELIVVEEPIGTGPAAGRNAGAAEATGSVLVFVDSDVIVRRDTFSRIRAAYEANPGLVALFGSYDDSPSPYGVVSTFRNLLHHYMHQRSAGEASTFWAGLGAVRREDFMAVGGFDAERFPVPSVEDVELGLRLHATGASITLDPNIQGKHLKEWLLAPMIVTDFLHRGVPWIGLLLEHGPGAARLNASRRYRMSAAACAGMLGSAAAGRRSLAVLLGAGFLRLNLDFYALLLRREGPRTAVAGIGLHILHNVIALAAAPIGALVFSLGRPRLLLVDARHVSAAARRRPSSRRPKRFVRGRPGPTSANGIETRAPASPQSRPGTVL
jgi:Glycosyl transferase family 2